MIPSKENSTLAIELTIFILDKYHIPPLGCESGGVPPSQCDKLAPNEVSGFARDNTQAPRHRVVMPATVAAAIHGPLLSFSFPA